MEEISIEKKKKPVWPWILLLVVVGLIIWAVIDMTNDNEVEVDEPATGMVIPATALPQQLTTYLT